MMPLGSVFREQYMPDNQLLPAMKMEDDEESYYHMYANKYSPMNDIVYNNTNLKVPPISSFCGPSMSPHFYNRNNIVRSNYILPTEGANAPVLRGNYITSSDGESSPKSLDEGDASPVYCVRGVRTITRNPGRITRQRTAPIAKNKARNRNSDYVIPKEKDRARLFNEAFDCLRKRIPSIPASKKLSKIEILRLAICYMSYLKFLLETDKPVNYDSPTSCSSIPCPGSPANDSPEETRADNTVGEQETIFSDDPGKL